jgi:aerobic-type carbon monoxide dehydrogenase small subunit (CoxS/CutS family)
MNTTLTFTLNDQPVELSVPARWTLLKTLRECFGLTGAKEGCGTGDCGACVVLLDGRPVNSCLVLAPEVSGHRVKTIEGLADDELMRRLQQAFLHHSAVQCGYCTPGTLMTAYGYLSENPHPFAEDVRWALAGNLCRCTGYERIVSAVLSASSAEEVSHERDR